MRNRVRKLVSLTDQFHVCIYIFFFFIRMTTIYETFYDIGYTLQFILDHIKLFPFLEATEKSMKTK